MGAVRDGRAEVGRLGTAVAAPERGLVALDLGMQPLVLISPPATALPGRGLTPADLAGLDFVTPHTGSVMRALVDGVLADQPDTRVVCELDHRSSLLPLVLAGVGHTILPEAWGLFARQSGLQVRELDGVAGLHTLAVSRAEGLTPLAADFMELAGFLAGSATSGAPVPEPTPDSHRL